MFSSLFWPNADDTSPPFQPCHNPNCQIGQVRWIFALVLTMALINGARSQEEGGPGAGGETFSTFESKRKLLGALDHGSAGWVSRVQQFSNVI